MNPQVSGQNSSNHSRRNFLKQSAAATTLALPLPTIVRASAVSGGRSVPPSDRMTLGCIGVGGMGMHDMRAFMNFDDVQVVAVCDVERESNFYHGGAVAGREPARLAVDQYYKGQAERSGKSGSSNGGCAAYSDFQELLGRDDIDAVTVTTPDHWHALISIAAARAGKDIYCEKPLANSIAEGRAVCRAVEKHQRVLQVGSHERSGDNARYAAELVRNGHLGDVHTVEVNLPCDDPHHRQVRQCTGIPPALAAPSSFDFDRWLGPAPLADYTPQRCHFWWRFILDYGGGEMTDRGAHVLDLAQMILDLDDRGPVKVEARGVASADSLFDSFFDYEFAFEYEGGPRVLGSTRGPRGVKFIGSRGWLFVHVHGGKLEAEPESLLKTTLGEKDFRLARSPGHQRNFVDCVKTRSTPVAPAEAGHRTATLCHLANIAMRTQRPLTWDPVGERIVGDDAAQQWVAPTMRAPWSLES